ncbi:PR domain zinc finger protein 10-like [Euwallacea similis]|uniref:PR domain zinc finger protein 10-like n=1 Tax=Euwallacea similis TaxID=1736056 RepID=UPI00344CA52B
MKRTTDHKNQQGTVEVEELGTPENWPNLESNTLLADSNSSLLYISVEYVCSDNIDETIAADDPSVPEQICSNFVAPHVSPLDPNMCSITQYSPVSIQYENDHLNNDLRPIIIHQYVSQGSTGQDTFEHHEPAENSLETLSASVMQTVLSNDELDSNKSQYLEVIGSDDEVVGTDEVGQLISGGNKEEVELLITDDATGKSYSIGPQEFLEVKTFSNDQLLESILPTEKIESQIYPMVKSNIIYNTNDEMTCDNETAKNYLENLPIEISDYAIEPKMITRSITSKSVNEEERLLSSVFVINDKPVLTKARASLPDSHLTLTKVDGENAVFARKIIPKSTQFGPLKGVLVNYKFGNEENDFLIHIDGNMYRISVSDENVSNWMGFIRKALNFEEQNLIVSQEDKDLYFTTTRNIQPKEELKVGYSSAYASQFKLEVLKPIENKPWPCYECPEKFSTCDELQRHFDVHDKENTKLKRKGTKKHNSRSRPIKTQIEFIECNLCQTVLNGSTNYFALKRHLVENHQSQEINIEEHFTILKRFQCPICDIRFKAEILLSIHKLKHNPELPLDQPNHVCPQCQRKFPTRKQLVMHVSSHALPKIVGNNNAFKCPVCHKVFAQLIRLQKHMSHHGSDENKRLQCKFCNKRFLSKSALSFHLKGHKRGEKHFQCVICRERFDHVVELKLHIPEHAYNGIYACPHCSKVFTKYCFLKKHARFHNEKEHHCPHCPKSFSIIDNLKKHLIKHSDRKEFLCADCGKQFKRKDKLSDHIKKIHKQESDQKIPRIPKDFHRFIYKCHMCLIGFKRRGMLVNHLAKRHPDISPDSVPELNIPILQTPKNYNCEYCDKVYKSGTKRKCHVLKVHPGAPLPVDNGTTVNPSNDVQSSASFSTPVTIFTRPRKCRWCHKQYVTKSKLMQHIRKAHPSNVTEEDAEPKENVEKIDADPATEAVMVIAKIPTETPKGWNPTYLTTHNVYSDDLQKNNKITTASNITQITPVVIDVEGEYQVLPIVY